MGKTVLEQLKDEAAGHYYDSEDIPTQICAHESHVVLGWVSNCWKAEVNQFLANHPEPPESKSVDEFAQKMITRMEPEDGEPVLTKYAFVAEAIDPEGNRCSYTAATDNISAWDEMGLLKYAMSMCDAKMVVNLLRD